MVVIDCGCGAHMELPDGAIPSDEGHEFAVECLTCRRIHEFRVGRERCEMKCKCGHTIPVFRDQKEAGTFHSECPHCGKSKTWRTKEASSQ